MQATLFGRPAGVVGLQHVAALLDAHHYLGAARRGFAWLDGRGALVFSNPSSRRLPQQRWLELTRWCILERGNNGGTQQWAEVRRWLQSARPDVTTVVSYSDPSAGHDGALYRACNWLWAPTWHRLRPPPTGNGDWGTAKGQAVKDRWVCVLRPDDEREALLTLQDEALIKRLPWATYREPVWKRGKPVGGGASFAQFKLWRHGMSG